MVEEWIVMRTKINEALESVLKQFGAKYFIDGVVNKSKVIQDLDTHDEELLTAFISNDVLKDNFTIDIAGNTVLQTNKLIHLLEADEYWQDSYTKYSKKIGLTAGGKFIDENEDVVLDFPYKDTILKASMSKEDTDKDDLRPDEPFLNEVIAKEEIDVLLDKKIFVNAKKYDENGVHDIDSFDENDNLVIKGNNLLALHTLKEKYAGKVKLIYIDPPYNTGNDSFLYNDRFNHASWLTFMKNRLEIAFDLLNNNGVLVIQSDNNENHYLKVLCDELFGVEKFVTQIAVEMSATQGMKVASAQRGNIVKNAEYLLIYSRSGKKDVMENILYDARLEYDTHYSKILMDDNTVRNVKDVFMEQYPKVEFLGLSDMYKVSDEFKAFIDSNQSKIFRYDKVTGFDKNDFEINKVVKRERSGKTYYLERKKNNIEQLLFLEESYGYANDFYSSYGFRKIRGDWWSGYYLDMGNVSKEGDVRLTNGKKPERLIKDLIIGLTNEKDIVLDFFIGSGTTPAVAHKTNRKYIGIEQMNYIHDFAIKRLRRVIDGDKTGVSKDVDWQGGGSFVYAELMEKNKGFIDAIRKCETQNDINQLFMFLLEEAEIDFRVDLEKVKDTLHELSIDDQKRTLFKIIEKNQLYYNYSEIDDENVRDLISDSDYKFNKSFYEGGE